MKIIISNASSEPIYKQIYNQIINQIVLGEIGSEEQLPSIRFLAKELKISVITTKRAYEELERDGYIKTVIGKGTYVSGINKELLKERQIDGIQKELDVTIEKAKRLELSKEEFIKIVHLMWD